jgi:Arc/MetJ-type ribon-helix-helix transcriptional regulator
MFILLKNPSENIISQEPKTTHHKIEKFIYYIVLQWNTMQVVTVKFQENVLKKIDKSIAINNFNSRTEFIREAVRDKLHELSRDDLMKEFMTYYGKAKKKTTYEEDRKLRGKLSKEFLVELKERFK